MNTLKQFSKSVRRWMLVLVGMAVVLSMAFTVPNGVSLAAGVPTPLPDNGKDTAGLSQAYAREQADLGTQQSNLDKAAGAVTRVQDLISQAQAKGLDTSALASALATFQTELATATSSHATAAGILSSHAGFDGSGNVTDPTAARQTVADARQNLLDAHKVLSQAVGDLRSAVKAWTEANRDQRQDQDLQKGYQNEQTWLTTQQANLAKTNDIVTRVQDLISKAQARGLNTSDLETALGTFQAEIATATGSNSTAAGILSNHAGFDGSGNVTDQGAALQTVKDARQALSDSHDSLVQAVSDLQKTVKQWLAENQPTATPAAPTNNTNNG